MTDLPPEFAPFRQVQLEDGEPAVKLRPWKPDLKYLSNNPHAGMWTEHLAYVLVPKLRRKSPAVTRAIRGRISMIVVENDLGVMLLGSPWDIALLLRNGPQPFRAQIKRKVDQAAVERLSPYRFKRRNGEDRG